MDRPAFEPGRVPVELLVGLPDEVAGLDAPPVLDAALEVETVQWPGSAIHDAEVVGRGDGRDPSGLGEPADEADVRPGNVGRTGLDEPSETEPSPLVLTGDDGEKGS